MRSSILVKPIPEGRECNHICCGNVCHREKKEAKVRKPIAKVSSKRLDHIKSIGRSDDLEMWFLDRRKELVGVCQCGCGNKSQKNDDTFFKHSICHIFPKSKFLSVATHPLNFVERAFWGGCHSVLDDTSMDKWVNMADFDDIKEKYHVLAPLLTEKERATKFYSHLEKLVYS